MGSVFLGRHHLTLLGLNLSASFEYLHHIFIQASLHLEIPKIKHAIKW